jgi:hypothetical protein
MTPWIWLLGTVIGGVVAYRTGAPAWRAYRSRLVRDVNTERYLAWRGRADRSRQRTEMTSLERNRLIAAGAVAVLAVFCLAAFLTYW